MATRWLKWVRNETTSVVLEYVKQGLFIRGGRRVLGVEDVAKSLGSVTG